MKPLPPDVLTEDQYTAALRSYINGSFPLGWKVAEKALRGDRKALLALAQAPAVNAEPSTPEALNPVQAPPVEPVPLVDGRILLDAGSSGPAGWSSRSRVLRCPRAYGIASVSAGPTTSDPLIKGSLVHIGVAHYYARLQAVQQGWQGAPGDSCPGPEAYLTPTEAIGALARRENEHWQKWVGLATEATAAYGQWHRGFHEHVIAVEHLIVMQVPWVDRDGVNHVFPHSARIDLITQLPDKRFRIIDTKTTSTRFEKTTPYDLSGQIIGLTWWGRQEWGDKFAGVELNIMRLGGWKNTLPFERMTPRLAPHAVREFPKTIAWSVYERSMLKRQFGEDALSWPLALSDSGPCMDRWGPCSFRELCYWGPDGLRGGAGWCGGIP